MIKRQYNPPLFDFVDVPFETELSYLRILKELELSKIAFAVVRRKDSEHIEIWYDGDFTDEEKSEIELTVMIKHGDLL